MNIKSINYTHSQNVHSIDAPRAVLPILFEQGVPTSLLDVGCGTGTWLRAALELGVTKVVGIDGVDVSKKGLLVSPTHFRLQDLTNDWNLEERFDLALCLEVAEHLPETAAGKLLDNLILHSNVVVFSSACPDQPGDHHLNCQWPAYWQSLFNARGFRCNDAVRWKIWNDKRIEPWYRQNLFVATQDSSGAGVEERMMPVIHPDMLTYFRTSQEGRVFEQHLTQIANGRMPFWWYFKAIIRATFGKIRRKMLPGKTQH